MATKTTFYAEGGIPSNGQVTGVKQATIDLSQDNAAIADVFNLFDIAADEYVLANGYEIITKEDTATATVDIGIDGGAELEDAGDITTGAGLVIGDATPALGVAGTYTAKINTAAGVTLKLKVWAVVANIKDPAA